MRHIKEVLVEISALLKNHKENEWSTTFNSFLMKIDVEEIGAVKKEVRSIYGGMGSFNDLVLYSNGVLSYRGNVILDELRRDLFDIINSP
jgi:hypothetical protein